MLERLKVQHEANDEHMSSLCHRYPRNMTRKRDASENNSLQQPGIILCRLSCI